MFLTPFRILQVTIALETKISVEKIIDNPGLIPLKLEQAKLEEYTHTLLHYYDLDAVIEELKKLYQNNNADYIKETLTQISNLYQVIRYYYSISKMQ